jgi:hypothetical protein
VVAFNALRENNRAGLVLDTQAPAHPDGVVFAGFGSLGDFDAYHGWLVGYDARTLKMDTLFCTDPNGDLGAVWFVARVPMGRMPTPVEVANAAVFLASDDSSYVTGIDLCVDGGVAQV